MVKATTKGGIRRVVFINDLHCGHDAAITPPGYGVVIPSKKDFPRRHKTCQVGHAIYEWFMADLAAVRRERPITTVVVVGDVIDGRGERSGSTELLTTDRFIQCRMAKKIITATKAPNVLMTYGTAYHTGEHEDFEDYLRDLLECTPHIKSVKLGAHEWLKENRTVFDIKHHAGGSTIPHGRATPLAREKLWNLIWADRKEQPNADVLIRAHTHYHVYVGDRKYLSISLPALQGMGSKYGARRCSGTVDVGYTVFDTYPGGGYTWEARLADLPQQKAKVIEF